MRHPFDLNPNEIEAIDLEFLEELSEAESSHIDGSLRYTTMALGEEGGWEPTPSPKPRPSPRPRPIDPPEATTLALGEEGGEVTTLAIGEEGGFQIQ
jgi:hypothetical protein